MSERTSSTLASKPVRRRLAVSAIVLVVLAIVGASTVGVWKPYAKRFKWFVVATNMYQEMLRRTHLRADQVGYGEGPQRTTADVPKTLAAIDTTFENYLRYSGLTPEALRGKRVLELGPGDNIGVVLRFAAAGAPFVSTIDKFVPLQDSEHHRALYQTIRDRLGADEKRRFDEAIDLSSHVALKPGRVEYIYGKGFEETDTYAPDSFDIIVSNAVLEEIYEIDRAFDAMDRLLRPDGYLLHKIDLSDYGMFVNNGFHPLEYLTIPDPVYKRMVESSGQPNRRLVDYYRGKMAALGYEATIYTSWVLGNPKEIIPHKVTLEKGVDYTDQTLALISSIRPRLLPRYKQLSDEDLMVQGIYLVARKSTNRSS